MGTGIGVGTAWIGSVGLTGTLRAGLEGESEVDFLVACLLRMSCTCCSYWDSEGVRAGKCELVLGFCSIFNISFVVDTSNCKSVCFGMVT